MDQIPTHVRRYWMPFETTEILYCLTPKVHLQRVLSEGLVPKPDYLDFPGVLLAYSPDPLYHPVHQFSVEAFRRQGQRIVRLHIRTANQLFRSLFPNMTYQLVSLDPISPRDIVSVEKL